MEKATTAVLKKTNRKNVYRFIYTEGRTTKQNIALRLSLSLPTVSNILTELESEGLIEKNGTLESSGGRKPAAICPVRRVRVAIGAEVTKNHLHLVCIDLFGTVVMEKRMRLRYQNNDAWYRKLGAEVNAFADSLNISGKRILGVGIAVQGVISADGQYVSYGKIMNCTGATLADFSKHIRFPCVLLHDSESAAKAELWRSGDIKDAIYLSLSKHLGSALIVNGNIHKGEGMGSGLVEHMVWQRGGKLCYCGKQGCLESYCSMDALLGEQDTEMFFEKARQEGTKEYKRWKEYMDILASAIDNMHMVVDCDVVLGGHLGPYITDHDVRELNRLAKEKCAFPETRAYIKLGKCPAAVIAIGAALFYISLFLAEIK
jgi:predicted NBD/HSP70 family sugar kinase